MSDPTGVLARINSTIEAWELGPDTARWYADGPPEDPAVAAIAATMQAIGRVFIEAWPGIMAAFAATTAIFGQAVENVAASGLALQKLGFPIQIRAGARSCPHRSLHEACDFCYPRPNPAARDYRRRTKHRNRRRR